MNTRNLKPVVAALGASFAATLAASPMANAADNPFQMTEFDSGYQVAGEGKCGEAKCGAAGDKGGEGKCGEAKCGAAGDKGGEGKCGEGKCGA